MADDITKGEGAQSTQVVSQRLLPSRFRKKPLLVIALAYAVVIAIGVFAITLKIPDQNDLAAAAIKRDVGEVISHPDQCFTDENTGELYGKGLRNWLLDRGVTPGGYGSGPRTPELLRNVYVCWVQDPEKCPYSTTYVALNKSGSWTGGGPFDTEIMYVRNPDEC